MKPNINPPTPVLAFHKVDPSFEWGVTRTTPGQFRRILARLKADGYGGTSLQTLLDGSPRNGKRVVLTFDDAYESVYIHALPLLKAFGFTATVFVITRYAGMWNAWDVNLGWLRFRHMSWNQIRELGRLGFEIGSHTVHHADLTKLNDARLTDELKRSKEDIEQNTGVPARVVSFPFGRYDQRVVQASREAGYEAACGFLAWKRKEDPFVYQRKACYLVDGLWNLKAKIGSGWTASLENAKLRFINFCSHGTSLVKPPRWED